MNQDLNGNTSSFGKKWVSDGWKDGKLQLDRIQSSDTGSGVKDWCLRNLEEAF